MKKTFSDSSFFIPLIMSEHAGDKNQFGNYLIPVYKSEETMLENHPGIPYVTIIQKNHKIYASIKGVDDKNV